MERKDEFLGEARALGDTLIGFCGKSGLLYEKVDAESGAVVSKRAIVNELGDYAQNAAYLGKAIGEKKYSDWALSQVEASVRLGQTSCGLFLSDFSADSEAGAQRGPFTPVFSLSNADTIIGLVGVYELTKSAVARAAIEKFYNGAIRMRSSDGFVYYGGVPSIGIYAPLSGPNICGNFSEEAANMFSLCGEEQYRRYSLELVKPWLESWFFSRTGLFAKQFLMPGRGAANLALRAARMSDLDTVVLMKPNTHLLFALLSAYRISKDKMMKAAALKWMGAVEDGMLSEEGYFFNRLDVRNKHAYMVGLEFNHSAIEAMIDIFFDLRERRALEIAEDCAAFWLGLKSDIGLMPKGINGKDRDVAMLDYQLDFAINLLKLYELTGKRTYGDEALDIYNGILKNHKLRNGFCWSVDCKTGKPVDKSIETKFMGLLLKGLLVMGETLAGKKIFQSQPLRNLARDR